MDHKRFLSQVPVDRRTDLIKRADLPGLLHFCGHVGFIVVVGYLIAVGITGWPLLLPVQGVLIVALFMLAHECTHETPFKTKWLNTLAGHFAGFWLALPFRWFRYFHLAHHKWTNIPGKDPELESPKPNGLRAWAWHVSGIPLWWQMFALLLRLARGCETPDWLPVKARAGAEREARIFLLLYASIAVAIPFFPVILWVWIIPVILGQPFLRLYLLAEHGDCPQVANMLENTRTTFSNQLVRWLTWNMPYHTEHHVWPNVPFHKLPALHADLRAHLRVTATGYGAFNRAYLARRLHPAEGMISPNQTIKDE